MVSLFSGYKDAGQFLTELQTAKQKIAGKQQLTGFTPSYNDIYPEFYKQYYDRQTKNIDNAAVNSWIKNQKDWAAEPVAMAIFRTAKLDSTIEDYLVNNYSRYASLYGAFLMQNKVAGVLTAQLGKAINKTRNDDAFFNF